MSLIRDVQQLRVGDYVTIYGPIQPQPRELRFTDDSEALIECDAIRGLPLKVKAISPPFLMCEFRFPNCPKPHPFLIELDRFQVSRLTPTYAQAYLGNTNAQA